MDNSLGSLFIDLQNSELLPEEKELIEHPLVGGIILFSRNYTDKQQLKHLCKQIRLAKGSPILIMADQEGGRVQRFIKDFSRLPDMASFGRQYEESKDLACQEAQKCGHLMASELLSVGIDLSLAPVLDLNKGLSTVIGNRAFHENAKVVVDLASAFMSGMKEAGMAAVGKHFPGHGTVVADSHLAIPIDHRTLDEIEKEDMLPFDFFAKKQIPAIMAAHIIFPSVDPFAVTFSRRWLQDILRDRLRFQGIILSDDLNMEGANISACYADRMRAAKEAGCDFVLLCNNRSGVIQALDKLSASAYQVRKEKWGVLKGNTVWK